MGLGIERAALEAALRDHGNEVRSRENAIWSTTEERVACYITFLRVLPPSVMI